MIKKIYPLLVLCIFLITGITAFSQTTYHHGAGAGSLYRFYSIDYTASGVNFSGIGGSSVPGIFYKATLLLDKNDGGKVGLNETKLALSTYPFFGLDANVNSITGASGTIGFEIPFLAELYFSHPSGSCFFAGGGFSISSMTSTYGNSGAVIGPQFTFGGQWTIAEMVMGARGSYTHGMNETKFDDASAVLVTDKKALVNIGVFYVFK